MALNWPTLNLSDVYAIRSQRDLTLNVSIDQRVNTGINLNSVLLDPLNYTSSTLSNFATLIQRGVNRVFLDIYWNSISNDWQLCPFVTTNNSATAGNASSLDETNSTIFAYDGRVYTCDMTITFANFLSDVVKNQWIYPTDNDLDAQTIVLTVNLRQPKAATVITMDSQAVATKASQATTSISNIQSGNATSAASIAMSTSESLSAQIDDTLDRYVYTPVQLKLDRSKALTWNDTGSSSQGWPLLENVLLTGFYRVLFSFGVIEVPEYNANLDADYIFSNHDIPNSGSGVILSSSNFSSSDLNSMSSSVCSISNGDYIAIMSTGAVVKPSWLIASDTSENPFSAAAMLQYMKCGFSPILNATLDSSSDVLQYLVTALESSRWSWEAGQPPAEPQPTQTVGATPTPAGSNVARCAALTVNGWEVENCDSKFQVACRVAKSPYNWTLSEKKVSYYDSVGACTGNSMLSVPRTAIQNTILQSLQESVGGSDPVWIDVNCIERPVGHIPTIGKTEDDTNTQ
ncbi:hypothetical protein V1509DRAFT_570009 [Lipomyces kononenkoae]